MKYRVEDELALATDLLAYANDPVGFVRYNYPWGVRGSPLENIHGPRGWQLEVLQEIGLHTKRQEQCVALDLPTEVYKKAVASGRGIGKSALFGWISHWQVSTHIGSGVLVTANTEGQLRTKTFPEFGRWVNMSMNGHWWQVDSLKISPQEWMANLVRDQLKIDPLYWVVQGATWSEENPDAFAGMHNSFGLTVLYDEASGIPQTIYKVTEGFFTEQTAYRQWVIFSNPRRNAGPFYERFHNEKLIKAWRPLQIDARTVEGTDKSVYESILDEYGPDSDTARVEVYGQFPEAGDNQLIANSVVRTAQSRELPPAVDDGEPLVMGVDPAPRGRTVIRFRQGRDGRSIKPTVLTGADNIAIANKIVELANKYQPDGIVVDGGNGTGVIDYLKRLGVKVFEVWFGTSAENSAGEWATRGAELWGAMRDWLLTGYIDNSPALFRDLTVRTWKYYGREDGKKILETKKNMAADGIPSPDDGDALALTFAVRLPRRDARFRRGRGSGPQMAADVDYNLLG